MLDRGGFDVAYDLALPRDYGFVQKCGTAWIGGDDMDASEDFRVKLAFAPSHKDQDTEFGEYMKVDAANMASDL
jgi:hypothetical protein